MEKQNDKDNFLSRKTERKQFTGKKFDKVSKNGNKKFSHNKNTNFKNKQSFNQPTYNNTVQTQFSGKSTQIEILYNKARQLYGESASEYDLEKSDSKNKENKWTAEILRSGTLEDKISSLALYIKNSPRNTLKYLDMLIKMAKKKNRRQTEMCVSALKDLFLDEILTNKKLASFFNSVSTILSNKDNKDKGELTSNSNEHLFTNEKLLEIFTDDFIHKKYTELIEIISDIIVNDPLKAMKKKYLNILLEMIKKRPEKEERILEILINKLGDPDTEVSNFTIKILKDLQMSHPKMSLVILQNVQNFMSKLGDINHTKYYSLVFLSQMNVINDQVFLEYSLNFFFDLFNFYSNLNDEETRQKKHFNKQDFNSTKFLSLIVKRINMICKFSSERKISIKELLDEKINTLFRLSHSESVKLRVEVLKLIFMICQGVLSGERNSDANSEANIYADRYYRSLYEILLMKEIIFSKQLRELLKLIMMSLSFDTNLCRVAAFLKRLLQVSLQGEPSFISCVLIITSQVLRNKHKLWKMIDKNSFSTIPYEEGSNQIGFDFMKRDPIYTHADSFPLSELFLLTQHYHPTIQKFSQFIMENYNKDIIAYEGDPLIDFSLLNFLEKFMLKNPKIKKDKKRQNKKNEEEEDLLKFIGDDEEENVKHQKEDKTNAKFELDFIKKFNEIEKVKSVKYEKNQERKMKMKISSEDADEEDIEKFADQVMDKEYEKYDKDVDEDEEFEELSVEEGEQFDNDEELDNFNPEEELDELDEK